MAEFVVGGADMINVSLTYTTFDRFGNDNAALALNGGYNFIPSGVYLNTQEFSISLYYFLLGRNKIYYHYYIG